MNQNNASRIFGLDILRCVAILFVLLGHGNALLPEECARYVSFCILDGVGIFFVLSGFLIGGILIRDFSGSQINSAVVVGFWERRWFRTLPAYFLVLCLVALVRSMSGQYPGSLTLLRHATFTQNIAQSPPYWLFPESWSLSIEEWFYISLPALIYFCARFLRFSVKRSIIVALALPIVICPLLRLWRLTQLSGQTHQDCAEIIGKSVVFRLDSIAFGVLGAYFSNYHRSQWGRVRLPLFLTGVAILLLDKHFAQLPGISRTYSFVLSYDVRGIGTLLLLPYLSSIVIGRSMVRNIVTHIALISYSMYLINYSLILNYVIPKMFPNPLLRSTEQQFFAYGLFWAITIGLSTIIYRYFEVPMMNLRNRPAFSIRRLLEEPAQSPPKSD